MHPSRAQMIYEGRTTRARSAAKGGKTKGGKAEVVDLGAPAEAGMNASRSVMFDMYKGKKRVSQLTKEREKEEAAADLPEPDQLEEGETVDDAMDVVPIEPVYTSARDDDEFSISSSRGPTPPPASTEPNTPLEESTFLERSTSQQVQESKTRYLTHEELEHAKSLVLDLLGWGVSPEYLVDSGVSPQIIFKIFTDLHLRLPYNITVIEPPNLMANHEESGNR